MTNTTWKIDPSQSEITFKIKKLFITTVEGTFGVFEGQLETESDKFESIENIHFKAKVDSIKTDDEQRDDHLKSADFFDVQAYPYFTFTASHFNIKDSKIEGDLSIRNISKAVTLDAEFLGISTNDKGETNAKLIVSGKVNRNDFGLTWSGKNAAGEMIVGDEVKLRAQVQFKK